MKRLFTAAFAGLLTFGAVYGVAASLNLDSNNLGAQTTSVAACQSGTLTASYTVSYSSSTPGYTVGTVTVAGLESTCYTKAYKVTLAGSGGTSLGESTGTTPSSGTSFPVTFSPSVNANSVTALSVVISG